jgi:hypothetical protein
VSRYLQDALEFIDDLHLQPLAAVITFGTQGSDECLSVTLQFSSKLGERLVPALTEAPARQQGLKIHRYSPANNPSPAERVQQESSFLKGGRHSHILLDLEGQCGIVAQNSLPLADGVHMRLKKCMQGFQIVFE